MMPRGEQRALLVLSLVLIISVLIRAWVHFLPGREPVGMEEFMKESHALMAAMAQADSLSLVTKRRSVTRHPSPGVAPSPVTWRSNPVTWRSQSPIDINSADSALLLPLPGIGPVFAGRIVKYRDLLGGFVCLDQLGEVYGMPEETLELIRDRIIFDSTAIQRILVDSASFGELLRHPYLGLDEVKALVEYRDFKKDISSLMELRENHILDDSTLWRVGPYFDLGK